MGYGRTGWRPRHLGAAELLPRRRESLELIAPLLGSNEVAKSLSSSRVPSSETALELHRWTSDSQGEAAQYRA